MICICSTPSEPEISGTQPQWRLYVIQIRALHLNPERALEYNRNVSHNGFSNSYSLLFEGKKFDQISMQSIDQNAIARHAWEDRYSGRVNSCHEGRKMPSFVLESL